jgi:hypothetical protein
MIFANQLNFQFQQQHLKREKIKLRNQFGLKNKKGKYQLKESTKNIF